MKNFVEGTTHVTYLKKKGARRDKRRCIYYNGNNNCGSASKCVGSAQCSMYITEEEKKKKELRELRKGKKKNA